MAGLLCGLPPEHLSTPVEMPWPGEYTHPVTSAHPVWSLACRQGQSSTILVRLGIGRMG